MQQCVVHGGWLRIVAVHVNLSLVSMMTNNEVGCGQGPFISRRKKCFEVEGSVGMQRFMRLFPVEQTREKGLRGTNVQLLKETVG